MDSVEIIGYAAAIIIGISLGLIGGGGSILTVPILVYLFGIEPMLATAYSLFVVGSSSLLGSISYVKKGLLNFRTGILFAIPSIAAVFITRRYLIPLFPEHITSVMNESIFTNIFFGVTLVAGIIVAALLLKRFLKSSGETNLLKVLGLMIPAVIMVFVMRQFVLPSIPVELYVGSSFTITKNGVIMLLFGGVMLFAAIGMIRNKPVNQQSKSERTAFSTGGIILLEGMLVGTLTGIVGAGGGFLIIPALVLIVGLPMKVAVGTSLAIIAVKSLIGFLGDLSYQEIEWPFLLIFTSMSFVGIFIGTWLSTFIDSKRLKKGFGWFVLVMGLFILIKEIV